MTDRSKACATATCLVALAFLPTWFVVSSANAGEAGKAVTPSEAKKRVLSKMASDPSVLINVTAREMPGSPDVLNLGKRATAALERCVSDNADTHLRARCVQLLREIGDRKALPTLRAALEDWEETIRVEVIWALETMPDPGSFQPMAKLYRRKDETAWVRGSIVDAMGALGTRQAVQFLRAELRKPPSGPDLRARVFRALWRSRHLMARTTLIGDVALALRDNGDDALVLAATEACAELRERQLARPLIPLMEHGNADIRNKAVYALGRIGDRTATRALLAHLPKVREARMLNNIGFALERLDPKAFYPAIEKLVGHKQAIIRLNAAFVVGDVKRPEGLPILTKALEDPSDFVRTSAIVAIGKLGTDAGIAPLEKFAGDPNASIRQEAIYAINRLSKGKRRDLVYEKLFDSKLAKSRKGRAMRQRAAVELGKLGDHRVRDFLLLCYEARRCRLPDVRDFFEQSSDGGLQGRLLLQWARGRGELTHLVGKKAPAGARPIAQSSFRHGVATQRSWLVSSGADLIGYVGDRAAADALAPYLASSDFWQRAHVGAATARLGHPKGPPTITADLDNAPIVWLPRLARVLSRIEQPAARKALNTELTTRSKRTEPDLALAAGAVLLAWDPEKGFFRFLDALASKSTRERELAARYLRRNRDTKVTWVMRRALARETRPFTRDRLRSLLDARR